MQRSRLNVEIQRFFIRNFDVRQEREDELETIDNIRKGIEFRGTNLWVLIIAIFIASLGLNVNSTAVIIGAMLISPLMGPIMGFGLGLGINDFDLIKRSFRNLALATVASIMASTLYFLITPLSDAQSELLARTQPTLYDVLIAFFGGLAGIVASSTRSKGNVIPGVAIATALMPPLCTAGFGLATGHLPYFFGALYLYFINSVFISLSTYLVVRLLNYPKKEFMDKEREVKVTRYVGGLVLLTIIPSIYLSYNLVQDTFYDRQIRKYVKNELNFPKTQVLKHSVSETDGLRELHVVLIGETMPNEVIENARGKLARYDLENTTVSIQQGFGQDSTNIDELRHRLMRDFYENSEASIDRQAKEIDSLHQALEVHESNKSRELELISELRALFPFAQEISCARAQIANGDVEVEEVLLAYIKRENPDVEISTKESERLTRWLQTRMDMENVKLIIE